MDSKDKCSKCLWNDRCHTYGECEHYTPLELDLVELIECERVEYDEAWRYYLNENNK